MGLMTRQRCFDHDLIDGRDATMHSPFDTAQRVLRDTTEQCRLAALAWMSLGAQIFPDFLGIFSAVAAAFIFRRILFGVGDIAGLLRCGLFGLARRLMPPLGVLFGPRC